MPDRSSLPPSAAEHEHARQRERAFEVSAAARRRAEAMRREAAVQREHARLMCEQARLLQAVLS
jgi:hypothetical protein